MFEALDQVRGVAPRVGLDLPQQDVLRLVGGHARHALQLALVVRRELVAAFDLGGDLLLLLPDGLLERAEVLLAPLDLRGAVGERTGLAGDRALEAGDLVLPLPRLPLGVAHEPVRLLLGGEDELLLPGLGVALRVAQDAGGVLPGPADGFGGYALAGRDPDEEDRNARQEGEDDRSDG